MRAHRIRGRLTRRAAERGMTLVEIMIVVIIMALIATGVAFAVIPMLGEARINSTRTDILTIKNAAIIHLGLSGSCPDSVQALVEARRLDSSARTTDAWGNEFQISCEGDEPVVISGGPDGSIGTEDDIRTDSSGQEQQ